MTVLGYRTHLVAGVRLERRNFARRAPRVLPSGTVVGITVASSRFDKVCWHWGRRRPWSADQRCMSE